MESDFTPSLNLTYLELGSSRGFFSFARGSASSAGSEVVEGREEEEAEEEEEEEEEPS